MKNEERYKTSEDRRRVFEDFCMRHSHCEKCQFNEHRAIHMCGFDWLEADESVNKYKEDKKA